MGLTGGPHLSAGGRERRRGRWWSGPRGLEAGVGRGWKTKGGGGEVDRGFSFSFSNPFLNQFQTFLNSNLLHVFKFKF
jgi:hypothetical protein